jgi:hypothetical protein
MFELQLIYFNWHGRETFRPDCMVSKAFCELLKQKTLTKEDVQAIVKMGYLVKIKENV